MNDDKIIVHFSRKQGERAVSVRAGDRASERARSLHTFDTVYCKIATLIRVFGIVFQSSENLRMLQITCYNKSMLEYYSILIPSECLS